MGRSRSIIDRSAQFEIAMRVKVDKNKCHGHNRCVALAPDVFDVDDEGLAEVMLESIPSANDKQVRRAELACPERAITIVE